MYRVDRAEKAMSELNAVKKMARVTVIITWRKEEKERKNPPAVRISC